MKRRALRLLGVVVRFSYAEMVVCTVVEDETELLRGLKGAMLCGDGHIKRYGNRKESRGCFLVT